MTERFRVTLGNNTVRFVDFEENKQLMSISFKKHNDAVDCQNALKFQCDLLNELNNQADAVRTELQLCEEENNALQERNDRQAETIRKLYQLITNKDWKALTIYMEELDKCEEQLQREWRLYSE